MPELLVKIPKYAAEARKLGGLEAERLYPKEIVGYGSESLVGVLKKDRVFAVAFYPISAERAKQLYYVQRIMATIFPHNFPHFYAAFGHVSPTDQFPTGTIRQRIDCINEEAPPTPLIPETLTNRITNSLKGLFTRVKLTTANDKKINYPFENVLSIFAEHLNTEITHDTNRSNFMIGCDGGEYYIDHLIELVVNRRFISSIDIERLSQYMRINKYSAPDQRIILLSLKRLCVLLNPSLAAD